MKVVVIGSKGFIGQHLLAYFKGRGHNVWGADVVVDYVDNDNYYLVDSSNSDFSVIFQDRQYDLCVNCSGAASVPDSLQHPLRDYFLNTLNVFRMLESIRKYQQGCKFINLSSAAVYGNPLRLPVSESEELKPISPYGLHKLQAEQICKEYYDHWNLPTCSLRIFSVYGDGLKKQLFWDLYKRSRKEGSLRLYGTGNESRDFIHVDDLVKVIDIVCNKGSFEAEIINVANGVEVFIKDAVAGFFACFDQPVEYYFAGESRKGDPVNWKADVSKLLQYGYLPSVELATGLQRYHDWVQKEHDNI